MKNYQSPKAFTKSEDKSLKASRRHILCILGIFL